MLAKIIGGAIVLWGIADLTLSMMQIDLWAEIGIIIPDPIWSYTHYIAIFIGFIIFAQGMKDEDQSETDNT
ncbi:hypothetical protein [Loktanella sp. S4079]|uniref:hypothetical protein n=1 Tax=Loktanella sp. S4079 TaxID=579483 RepID=UPI0005F9E948|nr:hypothetical protein [Loktanella sp. S4079]KJZ21121.1 hypothetical protein TW80_00220 [Loktanella sp. S4079]